MVHKVNTGASILAGLILALIHFILTVDTLVAWDALTSVSTNEVTARCPVMAGVGCTLIELLLTVAPSIAQGTLTVMRVASIDADT